MLFRSSSGSPSHSHQTRRRNKRHPNWKGRSKTLIICRWHDNPKDCTKQFLEEMSLVKFGRILDQSRNLLCFQIPIGNYQKKKSRKPSHLQLSTLPQGLKTCKHLVHPCPEVWGTHCPWGNFQWLRGRSWWTQAPKCHPQRGPLWEVLVPFSGVPGAL